MSINPVSFGKVTLVKAPLKDAFKIAVIANGEGETKLDKQVKKIINDTAEGTAYAYSFNPSFPRSYIFSGKESDKYLRSYFTAQAETNCLNTYYHKNPSTKAKIKRAWENHGDNINKIISSSKQRTIVDVKYNKAGEIKSVNISA